MHREKQGMTSQNETGALALDFNAYAQCVLNDVMARRDAFFREDCIQALQAVVCFYSACSVREVSKAYPEPKRNAETLRTLTTVAIPGLVTFLKEKSFDVPNDAAHLLMKITTRGEHIQESVEAL